MIARVIRLSISCPIHGTWREVLVVTLYIPYQKYYIAWKWNWTQTLANSVSGANFLLWVTGEIEPYIGKLGNIAIILTKLLLYNTYYNIFYNVKKKKRLICFCFYRNSPFLTSPRDVSIFNISKVCLPTIWPSIAASCWTKRCQPNNEWQCNIHFIILCVFCSSIFTLESVEQTYHSYILLGLWCLTPLSIMFQLYPGGHWQTYILESFDKGIEIWYNKYYLMECILV